MADLNKLRQTKEYQGTPRFTTKEHLNEVHNKLWGEDYYKTDEYDGDISEASKYYNETMNPSKYTKNDLEQAKKAIIDKILKHFDDTLFEMICDEMGKKHVFQHENYLTEAGYDVFEDEWFEFFHVHHGDILAQVKKEL